MFRIFALVIALSVFLWVSNSNLSAQSPNSTSEFHETAFIVVGKNWDQRLLRWDLSTNKAEEILRFEHAEQVEHGLSAEETFSENEIEAVHWLFSQEYYQSVEPDEFLTVMPRRSLSKVWHIDDDHVLIQIRYDLFHGGYGKNFGHIEFGVLNIVQESYQKLVQFDFHTYVHLNNKIGGNELTCTFLSLSSGYVKNIVYEHSLFIFQSGQAACPRLDMRDIYSVIMNFRDVENPNLTIIPTAHNIAVSPDGNQVIFYKLSDCDESELFCGDVPFRVGYAELENIEETFTPIYIGQLDYDSYNLRDMMPLAWFDNSRFMHFVDLSYPAEIGGGTVPFEYDILQGRAHRLSIYDDAVDDLDWYTKTIFARYFRLTDFPNLRDYYITKHTDQPFIGTPRDNSSDDKVITVITSENNTYEFDLSPFLEEGEQIIDVSIITK